MIYCKQVMSLSLASIFATNDLYLLKPEDDLHDQNIVLF
jgi:hypothetical protein